MVKKKIKITSLFGVNGDAFPGVNLLATDFFQILAHPVFKMCVIQKPNKVAL
jgi:hypothetical protein